ncbi:hypothetical protein KIS4809_4582 [Bacillus sp. ZZV12-4809]|nr:hypothetical protein KIS4809_4582 [Bacillus sp. ZZV12-4809]
MELFGFPKFSRILLGYFIAIKSIFSINIDLIKIEQTSFLFQKLKWIYHKI